MRLEHERSSKKLQSPAHIGACAGRLVCDLKPSAITEQSTTVAWSQKSVHIQTELRKDYSRRGAENFEKDEMEPDQTVRVMLNGEWECGERTVESGDLILPGQ